MPSFFNVRSVTFSFYHAPFQGDFHFNPLFSIKTCP